MYITEDCIKVMCVIVTFLKKERVSSITLPEKKKGLYWLTDTDDSGHKRELIAIEGANDHWVLKSNKNVQIIDGSHPPSPSISLSPLSFCKVKLLNDAQEAYIFAEPITEDRQRFIKRAAADDGDADITIGRAGSCDIVFANPFVSSTHAKLSYHGRRWSISDNGSTNGTFVNNRRICVAALSPGDTIFIMGLVIIIGDSFIACNNPDRQVEFRTKALLQLTRPNPPSPQHPYTAEYEAPSSQYFYRSPRFMRDVETASFTVDSPPSHAKEEEVPLMLVLGPSVTMGLATLTTGLYSVNAAIANGNIGAATPAIVMSGSMLLGTLLWPILTKGYDKAKRRKKEVHRQDEYHKYLSRLSSMLTDECARQAAILHENYVPVTDCVDRILEARRTLWERGPGQSDFLRLRLGLGDLPLDINLICSKRKFSVDDDSLLDEMYELCEVPRVLNQVPVTVSLFMDHVMGVIGSRRVTRNLAKGLIFQLAALYSYDEVKIVLLYDAADAQEFAFTKWLPHIWSDEKSIRFIAADSSDLKEVSSYFDNVIERRSAATEQEAMGLSPYYVVFALSKPLALRAEFLRRLYAGKKNIHFSVISFFDELKDLPKECLSVIDLGQGTGRVFNRNDTTGQSISFVPDGVFAADAEALSVKLANLHLDSLAEAQKLPAALSFLELFGVGKVEHLNALERWRENDPTKTLEAAVGVDTLGDVFRVDLHEKFHGPHGLVAGMTGSGKSEFIISYILSMAVNYHPHEVAFILIDYKGGGMAKSFEHLPHTAGIITNLDGSAMRRSLVSIESELKRRQTVFAEVGKKIGVSNIDIYKYQKLYREGAVYEPLQHLIIVSDEFAELKTQQPEFMAKLVSAARIGRSLGVHLILATQKPAGVVDDQIWSNSRFRVCLKVQERADSMDMLKRPDAAELSKTGRFYLQVGYNELFKLGQAAWAGAPYYPSDKAASEKDTSIVVIDRIGRPIKQAKLDTRRAGMPNPKKQLDAITDYLSSVAKDENIKVRPMWLEPMPGLIYLDELKAKHAAEPSRPYVLNPIIGEYDAPTMQQQRLLRLPVSHEGNALVFGVASSGKTTFLTTMIYSLLRDHTPDELHLYLLDFASETLRAFAKAPHVGDVIFASDGEKISNLFKMLYQQIEARKRLFAENGGDYAAYLYSQSARIPSILLAINNYNAFTELYEDKEEAVFYLTREGPKYGIYFVLTANGSSTVRFRLLQNFKQQFVLQQNNDSDYATILGKTDGLYPAPHKGRGLVRLDELYEFQIAHVQATENQTKFIQEACRDLQGSWQGTVAKKVPILPDIVDSNFLENYMDSKNSLTIPIGVDKNTLQVRSYPLDARYIHPILSTGDECWKFAAALCCLLAENYEYELRIFDAGHDQRIDCGARVSRFASAKECSDAIDALFDLVVQRHNATKEALAQGRMPDAYMPVIIAIHSVSALAGVLNEQSAEKLNLILERGEAKYGVMILLCESVSKLSAMAYSKWYKKHISGSDGIWIGSGITDQYQLKIAKATGDMRDDIPSDFGFVIEKGKATLLKVLSMKEEDQ